jgi:hypothetical protein
VESWMIDGEVLKDKDGEVWTDLRSGLGRSRLVTARQRSPTGLPKIIGGSSSQPCITAALDPSSRPPTPTNDA